MRLMRLILFLAILTVNTMPMININKPKIQNLIMIAVHPEEVKTKSNQLTMR